MNGITDKGYVKVYHSLNGLFSRVWCIKWNHNGTILASCGDDKTVKLWKFVSGTTSFL